MKPLFYGAPGAIPTRDLPLRRRTLYAAELREHKDEVGRCYPVNDGLVKFRLAKADAFRNFAGRFSLRIRTPFSLKSELHFLRSEPHFLKIRTPASQESEPHFP